MNIAITITCSRILLALYICFAPLSQLIVCSVLAGITDFLDGFLARKLKCSTNFGSILDPLADKLFLNIAFYQLYRLHFLSNFIFSLLLLRDIILIFGFITVYFKRIQYPATMIKVHPILLGKTATAIQFLCIFLFFQNFCIAHNMMLLSIACGYYSLWFYVQDGLRYIHSKDKIH